MTPTDLDRVIEIEQNLKEAPHWPLEAYGSALRLEAMPRRIALVAEDAQTGRLEGYAIAAMVPPEAELETIAVATEYQHRGLGRRLFSALAGELREAKIDRILLEVRASNYRAQALYRSLEFEETGRRPRYYTDPVEDAVLLRLAIR